MDKPVNNRAWLLVLPVLVLVAFSAVIPLMTVVNYSVQDTFGNNQFFWNGLGWFQEVLESDRIHAALGRQLLFSAIILAIEIPLGIFIALNMPKRGFWASLVLVLMALPLLIPWNVVGTIWQVFGRVDIGLLGHTLAALGMAWREYRAWSRFARIDAIQRQAGVALAEDSMDRARTVADDLLALYRDRPEMEWPRKRLEGNRGDAFDARTLLTMAETELLAQLDQDARREIEAAARTVAAATALIPLALADVAAALAANLRMIRRMAEIYGGRAGAVGGWRLARTVITHLVATGAVAAGDDLVETIAGGGILSKVSRRFGEGVVNGALTARVGIAAMEVCRPLPFIAQPRPKVGNLVTRGLRGLFGSDERG